MAGLDKCTVLIVDSNDHMRQILEVVVRGFGARKIHLASNGSEAFKYLSETIYDLVLIDFVMADCNGTDVLKSVRRTERHLNRYSAFIGVSSSTERWRIEVARDAGVSQMCVKPIVPRDLLKRIMAVVETPRDFIQSESYHGPDRRRKADANYTGVERRLRQSDGDNSMAVTRSA